MLEFTRGKWYMTKSTVRAVEILLVEDNLADIRLTKEILKDSKVSNNLHYVMDGVEAICFLKKETTLWVK